MHFDAIADIVLSPVGQNVVFCFSRFCVTIADFMKLSIPYVYKTWSSSISSELINVTQVLLGARSFSVPGLTRGCTKPFFFSNRFNPGKPEF